jgi:hypothetical protein
VRHSVAAVPDGWKVVVEMILMLPNDMDVEPLSDDRLFDGMRSFQLDEVECV